jgi:hypothetical protein
VRVTRRRLEAFASPSRIEERSTRNQGVKTLVAGAERKYKGHMADVLLLSAAVAFFALCVALVNGCDRIIGPDDVGSTGDTASSGAPSKTGSR